MRLVKRNKTYFLNPENQEEEKKLTNFLNKFLDIEVTSENNLSISIREQETDFNIPKETTDVKQKIFNLLEDKNLSFKDKMQGFFENFLNKKDVPILEKMLKDNEIEIFKTSEKYKTGVYRVVKKQGFVSKKPSFSKSSQTTTPDNLFIHEFLSKKYIILKNAQDAKIFSENFSKKIKSKEIMGIKSFDGNYYVIFNELYKKCKNKILGLKTSQSFSLDFFKEKTEFSPTLLKIVFEILKEEGFVIEKRKDLFEFI